MIDEKSKCRLCSITVNKMLIQIIFLLNLMNFFVKSDGTFGRLVIESEDSTGLHYTTPEREAKLESKSYYRIPCSANAECVPLAQCNEIMYEAAKSCYAGDNSMFCGVTEYDTYVCCPRVTNDGRSICGKSLVQGPYYRGLGANPFVARVGFKNTGTRVLAYPCTGSIISKRVILTAAHCALAKADGHRLSSVRIGEFDISRDPDCGGSGFCAPSAINHAISHVIVHPDYINGQYHHDIALIILRTPLNYTVAAQPICLKIDQADLTVGRRATIAGWGKISSSGIRSPQMQYLEIPLTPWETCIKIYGQTGALDSIKSIEGQWLCAGGEGRDACQGFGGAPLVVKENGIYSQIGIMSFGSDNCGGVGVPSVYTSISYFAKWIEDNSPAE